MKKLFFLSFFVFSHFVIADEFQKSSMTPIFGEKVIDDLKKESSTTINTRVQKMTELTMRYPKPELVKNSGVKEFLGRELPSKTLVLTFDDGPHPKYTLEIARILKQYNIPGVFFHVGERLGHVTNDEIHWSKLTHIDEELIKQGFVVGNHSYSHPFFWTLTDKRATEEYQKTKELLESFDSKNNLFRFPYGARNLGKLKNLKENGGISVLWNIDSLDWFDHSPESIAQRVMDSVHREGRGIILFHDIHPQSAKTLPLIIPKLISEGYKFADWNGTNFVVKD